MDIGLVIGKANSTGVPGKNLRKILNRPSAEYAFIAGKYAQLDRLYVSTDSPEIARIGKLYGASHIERPPELATPDALTEDVLTHAYQMMNEDMGSTRIETISLLFCNNPAVDVRLLRVAISVLRESDEFDSCFSVARYDMFTPARARRVGDDGEIKPYVDPASIGNVSSIRSSSGATYFCDLSIQVMKPICFEQMDEGQLPFKWQGRRSKAIETDFGFDIDSEWQSVVVEYWLRRRGFTEDRIPWE